LYYPYFAEDLYILFKNGFELDTKGKKELADNFRSHDLKVNLENYEHIYDKFEKVYNNNACINIFINGGLNKLNHKLFNEFVSICESTILYLASTLQKNNLPGLIVFTEVLSKKLRFDFDFRADLTEYKDALYKVLVTIENFKKLDILSLEKQISKHFNPHDNYIHFSYINKQWQVTDPLSASIKFNSDKYKVGKDFRINKPTVLINENSHTEVFKFENKWTLKYENKNIRMFKPNDVSLYSNISNKNLIESKKLYEYIINSGNLFPEGVYLDNDSQKIYFDYFEKIIQSVIAAFTSIEALLNLCIKFENEYEWKRTDKKKSTIVKYTGCKIERFPFKEKIKFITFIILMKSQKEFNELYSTVEKLKNIRDEIIHAKPSKSEVRYSKFLTAEIFKIIDSHKEFIKIFGTFISENAKHLLNEFPYNFGQDEFFPTSFTDEETITFFKDIHDPSANFDNGKQ
jgi:hypothetical protein